MKTLRNVLIITCALLLQSTFLGKFDLFGVRPDIALIALIFLAGETSTVEIIAYGFFIGFIQDVYSPEFLGYNAFAKSVTAFLLDIIKERLTVENNTVKLLTTLLSCSVHDCVYLLLYTKLDMQLFLTFFVRESLPAAVYTSVAAMVIVQFWQWAKSGGLFFAVREILGSGR